MAEAGSRRVPLSAWIVVALALGLVAGPLLGARAEALGEVGRIVIQLIKAAATPLLFLTIVNAVVTTDVSGRDGARMLGFATLNAAIALGIGLLLSNALHPGRSMVGFVAPKDVDVPEHHEIDLVATLASYLPADVVSAFEDNAVLTVVILALLLGFGLRRVRTEQATRGDRSFESVQAGLATVLRATEVILGWIIRLVPFAVFAVVTKTVGEYGYAPFRGLAVYVAVGLLGHALHVGLTYNAWVAFASPFGLRPFWSAAREPIVYAVGSNSSLATLPITLQALDRLGVRRSSSALGACVGTNFNNDGILLYEGMAVLFVAQAVGIDLSLGQQVFVALACVIAAMGVAGVPEAGFVSLGIVLLTVGLPDEILPLLLTVDWVLARSRSVVNVLSDMVLSILVDRR